MSRPSALGRKSEIQRQRALAAAFLAVAGCAALVNFTIDSRTHGHAELRVAARAGHATTTTADTRHATTLSTTRNAPVSAPRTTRPSAPRVGALAGKIVAIDPGHNGKNYLNTRLIDRPVNIGTETRACDTTGTETQDGKYTESAFNLDVSLRLAAILRAEGATVVLTRTNNDGWGPCIDERAAIGNRSHADVAISIHADGGPDSGHGFHVLYPESIPGLTASIAPASLRLAYDIRRSYHDGTGMPYATYIGNGDGLMQRRDLGGLNLSTVPKVFIESGNMRNASDELLLENPSFRQRAAAAIAAGLTQYLEGR